METEDRIALHDFGKTHGGLMRNGDMCFDPDSLNDLLNATRANEREACAKVCEDGALDHVEYYHEGDANWSATLRNAAAAIRARK